ncbi:MAG: phosphotransferase [Candidatus Woesearchaeota archaeon]
MNKYNNFENCKIKPFSSGMKNNVGRVIIEGVESPYVIKRFPDLKKSDITDMFKTELKSYRALVNTDLTPKLIYYDEFKRLLTLSYANGKDLNQEEIGASKDFNNNISPIAQSLAKLYTTCSHINVLGLRNINLHKDLNDGIDLLLETGLLKYNKNLDNAVSSLNMPDDKYQFVHGSLNPGNIIYDSETNSCKFIDFELAAQAPSLYDIGFLIARNGKSSVVNTMLTEIFATEIGQEANIVKETVDLYRVISSVLLLGLDSKTLRKKYDVKINNRFKSVKNNLNQHISNNQNTHRLTYLVLNNMVK